MTATLWLRLPLATLVFSSFFLATIHAFLAPSLRSLLLATSQAPLPAAWQSPPRLQLPSAQSSSLPSSSSLSTTALFGDLWDRMCIEEDDKPYWYLLNCVAGNEMDLLQQCRQQFNDLDLDPQDRDAIKFVVPTITKTRSHGAKRMVQESKVKFLGYVFAYVRINPITYEGIQSLPLHRSFMGGGMNQKGYKKLPPAPIPLNDEEIEKYGLEEIDDEEEEAVLVPKTKDNLEIILDTEEFELEQNAKEAAIDEVVRTVYNNLRVDDMVKVTAKNKFFGEDGSVRRLKEGKVLIRFFTYGTIYDEWLDPLDVRKKSDEEVLKGLTGPSAPVTQEDLDGGGDNNNGRRGPRGRRDGPDDRFVNQDSRGRNRIGRFGDGPRNRRQDRTERNYQGGDGYSNGEDNWSWYKENERHNEDGGYADSDEVEIRGSRQRRDGRDNSSWAESDVNSQWGRRSQRQERRENRQRESPRQYRDGDLSSFISESPSSRNDKIPPSKEETDDFFESLMADLSNDLDGKPAGRGRDGKSGPNRSPNQRGSDVTSSDDDDDFFASLMSEISEEANQPDPAGASSTVRSDKDGAGNDTSDFLDTLLREGTDGSEPHPSKSDSRPRPTADEQLEDIFAEVSEAEHIVDAIGSSFSSDDPDDFFATLEMELAAELDGGISDSDSSAPPSVDKRQPQKESSNANFATDADDADDFFAGLEAELESDLSRSHGVEQAADVPAPPSHPKPAPTNVSALTVPQLKEKLREKGLKVSGKKAELIERLKTTA